MAIYRIQIRRGTSAEWVTVNPILAAGEFGMETDSRRIKIGTGNAVWTQLLYIDTGPPQTVTTGGLANLSGSQQLQITTGTVVATPDGRRWMYTGTGSKTAESSYLFIGDTSPDWSDIGGKPTAFTPPLATAGGRGGGRGGGPDAAAVAAGTAGRAIDAAHLKAALDLKADSASLAVVATTGSYGDLVNQPTEFDGGNF